MTGLDLTKWRNPKWRKKTVRYWVTDPIWGVFDIIGYCTFRYMPIPVSAALSSFLGVLVGTYRYPKVHNRVLNNLAILRPDLPEPARVQMAINMWEHLGQTMSEYSMLDRLYKKNRVSIENKVYLQPFIETRQPVIFVFAHTGNWEVCGNYVIDYGFDVMGLYKPVRNRFSRRIAEIARSLMGGVIKLVDADDPKAMRHICRHLANKGALWIGIDEYKNAQVHGPRFGRPLQTQHNNAALAVRLAQRFEATVIPVLNKRNEGSCFTVKIGKPFKVAKGDTASVEALLELDQLLELWVLDNLQQWYMLHELRL